MKKSNTPPKKTVAKSNSDQPATIAPEAKVKASGQKTTTKAKPTAPKSAAENKIEQSAAVEVADTKVLKPNQAPKVSKKSLPQELKQEIKTPELALPERIGLTAGNIWHYLSEYGSTSVAKLVRELSEEEKVIQRSIGWLAQEGKISLETIDRVETISLIK